MGIPPGVPRVVCRPRKATQTENAGGGRSRIQRAGRLLDT